MGKLLDYRRFVFLADCTATCSISYSTRIRFDYRDSQLANPLQYLFYGTFMGYWRLDLWTGCEVFRCISGKFRYFRIMFCVRCSGTFCLLLLQSCFGKRQYCNISGFLLGPACFNRTCNLCDWHHNLWKSRGIERS